MLDLYDSFGGYVDSELAQLIQIAYMKLFFLFNSEEGEPFLFIRNPFPYTLQFAICAQKRVFSNLKTVWNF